MVSHAVMVCVGGLRPPDTDGPTNVTMHRSKQQNFVLCLQRIPLVVKVSS